MNLRPVVAVIPMAVTAAAAAAAAATKTTMAAAALSHFRNARPPDAAALASQPAHSALKR